MAFEQDATHGLDAGEPDLVQAPVSNGRAQSMQRVQIGLIGLAAMALLVGLANIIIANARQNQAEVVPEAAPTVAPQAEASPVSDPLADVGVVPDLPVERSPAPPPVAVQPPPVDSSRATAN